MKLAIALAALLALAGFAPLARAIDPIVVDKWRPPFANMEQVPAGFVFHPSHEAGMAAWNQIVDLYRSFPGDGIWGKNNVSEFGGFPSDQDLFNLWGFHWGANTLALTTIWYDLGSNQILESDVIFNPAFSWTKSAQEAEQSPNTWHLPTALLHELGHAIGVQTSAESYSYAEPSAMHAIYANVAVPGNSVHAHDAKILRAKYQGIATIPQRSDLAVFSHRVVGGSLFGTTASASFVAAGAPLGVSGLTVENPGTQDLANVKVRLWLSKHPLVLSQAKMLGEWTFASFPKEVFGTYDFTGTVPADTPPGAYYVLAQAVAPKDDVSANDLAHLKNVVNVTPFPGVTDPYEPNDNFQSATTVGPGLLGGLAIALNDQDWFKIWLAPGQRLEAGALFSHANGNLDLRLFDPSLIQIDQSLTFTDDEWAILPIAITEGYYFVQVFGVGGAQNGYALQMNVSTVNQGGGAPPMGGSVTFVPGDRLSGVVSAAALEGTFHGVKGMKVAFKSASLPAGFEARLAVRDPQGAEVKAWALAKGKGAKKTVKLKSGGVFTLRVESANGGLGPFELQTSRSLPGKLQKGFTTELEPDAFGAAAFEFPALPGTIADLKVKLLAGTPDTITESIVRPDGTAQYIAELYDSDGVTLLGVPLGQAGAHTFHVDGFPSPKNRIRVRFKPTAPAPGTALVALPLAP